MMVDQRWYKTKTCRLLCMLALTFSFFLVELIYGYITHSLALIGDSYHMLSDVVALGVGIASVRISKLNSQKNTYGWARAEVMGALVNSVFLIALCFTIFIEAIERLTDTKEIEHEDWMLIVGGIGLAINIVGLFLFHQHSHGHGHSHGGSSSAGHSHHGHSHGKKAKHGNHDAAGKKTDAAVEDSDEKTSLHSIKIKCDGNEDGKVMGDVARDANESDDSTEAEDGPGSIGKQRKIKSSAQLNMRGVFLHVLGDALGSVVVIISALVIKFCEGDWKYKVDPAMSMVLVCIILSTTIPLREAVFTFVPIISVLLHMAVKESALILMQTVPTHIQVSELKKKLINKVEGVLAVHEFHVWQLAGNRIIASAHIRCLNVHNYMRIAEEVKSFFHNEGIHSTTIQPEFVEGIVPVHNYHSIGCLLDCPCKDEVKCCTRKNHVTSAVREFSIQNGATLHPDGVVVTCNLIAEDRNVNLPQSILPTSSHAFGKWSQPVDHRIGRPKSTSQLECIGSSIQTKTVHCNSMSRLDEYTAAPVDITGIALSDCETLEHGNNANAPIEEKGSSIALRYRTSEADALELAIKRMSRELDDIRGGSSA